MKKNSCRPVRPTNYHNRFPNRENGNKPMWVKIFQPVDQPTQTVNFTVPTWTMKFQSDPLELTDQPAQSTLMTIPKRIRFLRIFRFKIKHTSPSKGLIGDIYVCMGSMGVKTCLYSRAPVSKS